MVAVVIDNPKYFFQQKENVLMIFGLSICAAEFILTTMFGYPYHIEFFIGGAAFCGVSVFQKIDKK